MRRTTSNISSTSSDILVGSAPPQAFGADAQDPSPLLQDVIFPEPQWHGLKTVAVVTRGRMLSIRFRDGSRNALAQILRPKRRPSLTTLSVVSSQQPFVKQDDYGSSDDDGPNHRGTYSRAYVLKHPEITWEHRGQGRYLPATEVVKDVPSSRPMLTRNTENISFASVSFDDADLEDMFAELDEHFDAWRRKRNPNAKDNWSPSLKHQFNQIVNLLKQTACEDWAKVLPLIRDQNSRTVTREWLKAMHQQYASAQIDTSDDDEDPGIRTRFARHAKVPPSLEARRSSRLTDQPSHSFSQDFEEDEDEDAVSDDDGQDGRGPRGTYKKSYIDARPDEEFYHVGNGWYKKGSKPQPLETVRRTSRRESATSYHPKLETQDSYDPEAEGTVHKKELFKHPGHTFHHTGNGWYRPGIGPHGKRASITVTLDGVAISNKHSQGSDDDNDGDDDHDVSPGVGIYQHTTVDKEYTLLHPDVEWVHRGGGRYRRKSSNLGSLAVKSVTPVAPSGRRSSRADESFIDRASHEDLFPRTGFRQKRASLAKASPNEERSEQLFDKSYVDAHPEEQFHHRGQGRYARGHRPKLPTSQDLDDMGNDLLVDTSYVDAHPDETFHHRGQGKWARGLPPPGSSNKTAVRGPGAKDKSVSSRRSRTEEVDEDGNRPPGLHDLVKRDEGPDKWPQLQWFYRGGGKWCRSLKEDKAKAAAAKQRNVIAGRAPGDGPDAQLRRESRAAAAQSGRDAATQRRRIAVVRRRSGVANGGVSKASSNNSQSKAPTPRPELLPEEKDILEENDHYSPYLSAWPVTEEHANWDDADKIYHRKFKPLNHHEAFVRALTRYDPAVRRLKNLNVLAVNAYAALKAIQDEYLELDKRVATHPMIGKKERRPVKGGRVLVEDQVWEDRKEAMLYDYTYDARKVGYQDPQAQRIVRDAEGRELRRRRNRQGIDLSAAQAAIENEEEEDRPTRRAVKPISRFDGVVVQPPRKRSRLATAMNNTLAAPSIEHPASPSPERVTFPTLASPADYVVPTRGRWKGHIPKRVAQLRGDSVGSSRSDSATPKPGGVRKGRPPGSKNLHKRKDAGIKKGPRKPKFPAAVSTEPSDTGESVERDAEDDEVIGPAEMRAEMDGVHLYD